MSLTMGSLHHWRGVGTSLGISQYKAVQAVIWKYVTLTDLRRVQADQIAE